MPLPTTSELREMLDEATPAPWQFLDPGYITAPTTLAVIDIYSRWVGRLAEAPNTTHKEEQNEYC